jgi:CheY-like chemotaxis protein
LLSNAFKFTHEGSVTLNISAAEADKTFENEVLNSSGNVVRFRVTDTGIGVPKDKQKVIFEPFQQADGTTSRTYGGTGLGLSISREIARLLGGEIQLESEPGKGSTFTVYLPIDYVPTAIGSQTDDEDVIATETDDVIAIPEPMVRRARKAAKRRANVVVADAAEVAEPIQDDRAAIVDGDRVLLVVEDDRNFARILLDLAHGKGFKAVIAERGEDALNFAKQYKPDAITLDIQLPGIHGLTVLDRLKHDSETRHIPVHIVSIVDELPRQKRMGAMKHLQKPVTREQVSESFDSIKKFVDSAIKRLLIVEDDEVQRKSIAELVGDNDIEMVMLGSGADALKTLAEQSFDCVVIDLGLPDMNGVELIEKIRRELKLTELPIIVYTGRDLSPKESAELNKLAEAVIVKDVSSIDKLLDETALFLHRIESKLPEDKRRRLDNAHNSNDSLIGRKILVVDDDVRNIFALTSFLERYKMDVVYAETGHDALKKLEEMPGVDAVLMDVMMPGMDGYDTMRAIRKNKQWRTLPIIAVTAKAMRGDREKCIEAGASDYITKPVDLEQLLSLLRVWLFK